jgi:hypothetical protein
MSVAVVLFVYLSDNVNKSARLLTRSHKIPQVYSTASLYSLFVGNGAIWGRTKFCPLASREQQRKKMMITVREWPQQ